MANRIPELGPMVNRAKQTPEPESRRKILQERPIGRGRYSRRRGKPMTDRNIFTASSLEELDRQISSATAAVAGPNIVSNSVAGTRRDWEAIAMPQEQVLTHGELDDIEEYERIVRFANTVLAGKHPRIKIPAQEISQPFNYASSNGNMKEQQKTTSSRNTSSAKPLPQSSVRKAKSGEILKVPNNKHAAALKTVTPNESNPHATYIEAPVAPPVKASSPTPSVEIVSPTGYQRAQPPTVKIEITSNSSDGEIAPTRPKEMRDRFRFQELDLRNRKDTHTSAIQFFVHPAIKSESRVTPQSPRIVTVEELHRSDTLFPSEFISKATEELGSYNNTNASRPTEDTKVMGSNTRPWKMNELSKQERKLFKQFGRIRQFTKNLANKNSSAKSIKNARKELADLKATVRKCVANCKISPEKLEWLMKKVGY